MLSVLGLEIRAGKQLDMYDNVVNVVASCKACIMLSPFPPNICRTQAACHWTKGAMVSEGEAVFGHICHEEWRPELVLFC